MLFSMSHGCMLFSSYIELIGSREEIGLTLAVVLPHVYPNVREE